MFTPSMPSIANNMIFLLSSLWLISVTNALAIRATTSTSFYLYAYGSNNNGTILGGEQVFYADGV